MTMIPGVREGTYIVKDGGAIYWPDGELRGLKGYVVRGDDPFMDRYFVRGCQPAMLERVDGADPEPPAKWPAKYRRAAGETFLTRDEIAAAEADAQERKVEEKAKREKAKAIASEIPEPDEE